jgi:hypothetical protein
MSGTRDFFVISDKLLLDVQRFPRTMRMLDFHAGQMVKR